MRDRALNEERGEKSAAELRRRFRKITDASLGRKPFGLPLSAGRGQARPRRRRPVDLLPLCAAAVAALLFIIVLI